MYRIVDDHLVWFQFQTDYTQDWNLDFFLSLFTSYDGTVTYEKEVIEATPAITENGVFNVLSFSTVWTAKFHYQGYYYNVYLVFEEAGTCYYALGLDHSELLLAGKGTYSVSGYTLNLSITASGDLYTGTYDFNPNSLQLTQTSYTSITGSTATGTKLALSIDTTNDVEKIVNWGNTYTYRDPYSDWE